MYTRSLLYKIPLVENLASPITLLFLPLLPIGPSVPEFPRHALSRKVRAFQGRHSYLDPCCWQPHQTCHRLHPRFLLHRSSV